MSSDNSEVRVRFAPSPTGYLHVGGARTAFYNYLYAKRFGGKFILRIEDTDQARSTEAALKMQIEDLLWLGLTWDEGPDPVTLKDMGPYGPYRQSQRLPIYKKVADELIAKNKAYYCFMTEMELEAQRESLKAQGKAPHVKSPYAKWTFAQAQEHIAKGHKAVVRFRTEELVKDYVLPDLVRGDVSFPSDMVGDFVMLRSDGMPVYNFCCVVDDHMMKISHVLRAEEHLPNSLRQMMIYESMGWQIPKFGHLSLVLDEDKQKLSKRKGATSCHEFMLEGYLPEALKNFIALLGWSSPEGHEIMSEADMIRMFDVDRLHPAGAVFDAVKLKWMNAHHLRALSDQEIYKRIEPFLKTAALELPEDSDWQAKSVQAFKTSMETLVDAVELYKPISDKHFEVLPEAAETLAWPQTKPVLQAWHDLLEKETANFMSEERFLQLQDMVKDTAQVKGKNLFMPIRVAVIGKPHGTELKTLIPLMARTSLIRRAKMVMEKVSG